MRAWQAVEHGAPRDVLRLEDVDAPTPGPGEVLVRVDAVTLNFNDIDGIHGRYATVPIPAPYVPGMEVLGTVDAVGEGVDATLGDTRVVAIPSGAHGGYAEYVVAPASMTFPMPDEIGLPDAAAILMPFHLAALSLYVRAGVREGETVLVHAAAGGVGSAALQLARAAGARVIALAGSPEKAHFCAQLGADVAVDTSATDFVDAALEATGGRGVDVAFDTIGGEVTTRTFRCMAFGGRHVLAGFASGIEAEDEGMVPRPILFGNFSLVGVCLAYVDDPLAVKAAVGSNFLSRADALALHEQVLALVASGAVRPVVGLDIPFEELPSALDAMEQRRTIGRIVVRMG
ncbi:MAG TPA: NADPH:quinone oxidoreductase family protein [Acidimicrobiia bacterium]|nr:NADPH:quinone oxidoreductase family protein [Acidimicrobiia bacterium]